MIHLNGNEQKLNGANTKYPPPKKNKLRCDRQSQKTNKNKTKRRESRLKKRDAENPHTTSQKIKGKNKTKK